MSLRPETFGFVRLKRFGGLGDIYIYIYTENCVIRGVFRKQREFSFFEKNIYLFVYINIVTFKIVPIECCALVPALLPILETLLKLDLWDSL